MVFKNKRLGKKRVVRKRAKKPAVKPTMAKMMRRVALQTIHRVAENKITVTALTGPTSYGSQIKGSGIDWNGTVGTTGLLLPTIIPTLILGSGQGAREGNKIEPRYLQIRGTVNTNANFGSGAITYNVPFYVHMFIYKQKGNIFNSDTTQILQGGTSAGSALPFDGTLLRSTYPFNKDKYTILKHRIFKMANCPYTPTGSTVGLAEDGWGNGFKMCHLFKQNIRIRKSWRYNDQETNLPTNENMFVAFAVVNADSTAVPAVETRAFVNCESVLVFEDV